MLKALMEKVDNMQHKQRDGCYRIKWKCQESKTEDMKNAFSRLISRLDTIKEKKICEIKNMAIEINQTETQRENRVNKAEENIQELRTIPNHITYA